MTTTKREMIAKFDAYCHELTTALETVHVLLEDGRFADASKAMTAISQLNARTSVNMRAEMIRAGFVREDE